MKILGFAPLPDARLIETVELAAFKATKLSRIPAENVTVASESNGLFANVSYELANSYFNFLLGLPENEAGISIEVSIDDIMIEAALNPPPKVWTIGFRLNGKPEIHVKETTAKDGISAWQSVKEFYESGGDRISWVYTC